MKAISRGVLRSVFVLLVAGALGGCAARVYTPSATVAVRTAPPPMRYEAVPVSPGPGYAWVGGHWRWGGGHYVWTSGRYVVRPAAHQVYVRPVWVRRAGRYHYLPGRWVVRGRASATVRGRGRVIYRGRGRP